MFIEPKIPIKTLSDYVLELSDFFIDNPDEQTPWEKVFCQQAYRHYYLPLNAIRNHGVIQRGLQVNFFKGLTHTVDWGAGPGTASLALAQIPEIQEQHLIEKSITAKKTFEDLQTHLKRPAVTTDLNLKNKNIPYHKSLLVFSYSLTEMKSLPDGWNEFEAIMILEPSTQQDGRRLNEFRKQLIDQGYFIWAPCIHQNACPLIQHSKTDWCHDRFHVKAPDWFLKLEQYLPFKNRTVTTSYLLARRTKPTKDLSQSTRLVGDSMNEKGKTRQLICRGEQREFLTWMHKTVEAQTLPRGELIKIPADAEPKSNEIRVKTPIATDE